MGGGLFGVRRREKMSEATRGLSRTSPGREVSRSCSMRLMDANVIDFSTDENDGGGEDGLTEEERGLTHGYEGNFKVGDRVRVTVSTKIWTMPKVFADGYFDPKGLIGEVKALALYGKKQKTLCSAITPVQVEFMPNEQSAFPPETFPRKFMLHMAGNELELLE